MNPTHSNPAGGSVEAAKTDGDKPRSSPGQAALSMATGNPRPSAPVDTDRKAARHAADVAELEREVVRSLDNIQRLESAPPADKPDQRREAIAKAKTRLEAIEKRLAELKASDPSAH